MEDFHKIGNKVDAISSDNDHLSEDVLGIREEHNNQASEIDALKTKVNSLLQEIGEKPIEWSENVSIEEINDSVYKALPIMDKSERDRVYDLNEVDVMVACLAGLLGVIVDFLVVKIPKDVKYQGKFQQGGSSLTALLRKIGVTQDGKTSKWIEALEEKFKVNYDLSINSDIKGMGPKNHRIFSLAHDPSPVGLLFAMKDLASGTFSYIDKDGILRVMKVKESDFSRLLTAPIEWLGHIISDIFTSMGVPVPGHCLLRMLNVGELGPKKRSIKQIAEYMYYNGYDMRHLMTMSVSDLIISFVVRVYYALISPVSEQPAETISDEAYAKIKGNIKLHNLLFTAYSVAACGNVAKVCAYEGNPTAFNYAIWAAFTKEALTQVVILSRETKTTEKVIEGRHVIDENFERLLQHFS